MTTTTTTSTTSTPTPGALVRFVQPYAHVRPEVLVGATGRVRSVRSVEPSEDGPDAALVTVERHDEPGRVVTVRAERLAVVTRCGARHALSGWGCSLGSGHAGDHLGATSHDAHDTDADRRSWPRPEVEPPTASGDPIEPDATASTCRRCGSVEPLLLGDVCESCADGTEHPSSRRLAEEAVETGGDSVTLAEAILRPAVEAVRLGDTTGAEGHASAALVVLLDALAAARADAATLRTRADAAEALTRTRVAEAQEAVRTIGSRLREAALRESWCGTYENDVEAAVCALRIGAPWLADTLEDSAKRTRTFRVLVSEWVEVEAIDEDGARDAAVEEVYGWGHSDIRERLQEVETDD